MLALTAVAGVAALDLIHARVDAPSPGGLPFAPRASDEERGRQEAIVGAVPPIRLFQSPAAVAEVGSDGWGRRIIRHASLNVELPDVEQGVARLSGVVESAGGFISPTDSQVDQKGTARATITAFIPPRAILEGAGRSGQRGARNASSDRRSGRE